MRIHCRNGLTQRELKAGFEPKPVQIPGLTYEDRLRAMAQHRAGILAGLRVSLEATNAYLAKTGIVTSMDIGQ